MKEWIKRVVSPLLVVLKFVTEEYTTYWWRGWPFLLSRLLRLFWTHLVSRLYRLMHGFVCLITAWLHYRKRTLQKKESVLCLFIAWVRRDRGFFYTLTVANDGYETALTALRAFFCTESERGHWKKEMLPARSEIRWTHRLFYVAALRELLVPCDFGALAYDVIRDQIVEKKCTSRIRECLLLVVHTGYVRVQSSGGDRDLLRVSPHFLIRCHQMYHRKNWMQKHASAVALHHI